MKEQFPLLKNADITYLDSAATTQKPEAVLGALLKFYTQDNANVHRGVYDLSHRATELYEGARATVAQFIGAKPKEIVFTKGTTESMNLLAATIDSLLSPERTEIVVSGLEHHSNLLPWQALAMRTNRTLKIIPVRSDCTLDFEAAQTIITDKTALVAMTTLSNAFGTLLPTTDLITLSKEKGALTVVDAAQSIARLPLDVCEMDCDFLAFSGHKAYGPTGIGILYGKQALLDQLPPYQQGGEMVGTVAYDTATFAESPHRFEAGTPNIAGALGLSAALDFLTHYGRGKMFLQEKELSSYAHEQLTGVPHITVHSPKDSLGIISFSITESHSHDVASLLNEEGVCVRAGFHCAEPLHKSLDLNQGSVRASFGIYTTKEDIDRLCIALKHILGKLE